MTKENGSSQYKRLFKDTVLFAVSDFASKCITFLLLPLYTSVLLTDEYGKLDLLNNMVNLIYPLLTLAIVEATIRFALDKNEKPNEVLSTALLFIIVGTLLLVLISPLSVYFGDTFSNYWIAFVLLYNGYSLRMLFSYYCRGRKKNVVFAIQGILQTLIVVILNILFLVVFKWGLNGYLIATIASYYIATIFIIIAGKFLPDILNFKINKRLMKDMLKFSLPMIPTLISWWFINSMDKYYIIAMVGMGASGVYAVAHKIPTILQTVTQIFNKAWQISSVDIYESDNREQKYTNIYTYFCFICMAGCLVLNSFSELIATILFAKEYFEAWSYVPVLLVSAVFSSMAGFLTQIYTSAKKTTVLFTSTVVGAVVNAILNYIFIILFGTIGAAYGTLISFMIVWLVRDIRLKKIVKLKMNYFKLIISIIILIFQALIINYVEQYYVICSIVCIFIFMAFNYGTMKSVISFTLNAIRKKKSVGVKKIAESEKK